MNKKTIEILNAIIKLDGLKGTYDERLVIIAPREAITDRGSKPGIFVSFDNLSSEDFFEIYRYKKRLEESRDEKGK